MQTGRFFNTYGKRQKLLREEKEMQQQEFRAALANRGIEIGQGYVSELERTDKQPTGAIVAATADVPNTTADFLLGRTEDPRPLSERQQESHLLPEIDEAATLIDAMDKPHRDMAISMIRSLSELSKQKRVTTQYKDLAATLLLQIEKVGGNDLLNKTLSVMESRSPGASAVALRLRREQAIQDAGEF